MTRVFPGREGFVLALDPIQVASSVNSAFSVAKSLQGGGRRVSVNAVLKGF